MLPRNAAQHGAVPFSFPPRRLVVPILAPTGDQPVAEIHPYSVVGPVTLPRFILSVLPPILDGRAVLAEDHPVKDHFHIAVAAGKACHGRTQRLAPLDKFPGHHNSTIGGEALRKPLGVALLPGADLVEDGRAHLVVAHAGHRRSFASSVPGGGLQSVDRHPGAVPHTTVVSSRQ